MLSVKQIAFRWCGCAAAGVFALAMLAPASAQVLTVHPAAPVAPPASADAAQPAALSAAAPSQAPGFACSAPAEFTRLNYPLRHTARRLASGEPLTIVAIGSSSTAGAGASSPAASYPSRLAVELKQRFPTRDITVLNRGVNGETTEQMMARFATGVIAAHPDLVLWQVGTIRCCTIARSGRIRCCCTKALRSSRKRVPTWC